MQQRSNLIPTVLLVLLAGAVATPLVYALRLADTKAFWDGAMGNLLATAVALVVAIPSALWLERLATRRQQSEEAHARRLREHELLLLLKEELAQNLHLVQLRRASPESIYILPMKFELWSAFASSGNLQLISSRQLLASVANAYYFVRLVQRVEERLHGALRAPTVSFGEMTAVDLLTKDAQQFHERLETSLATALAALEVHAPTVA